MKEKKTFEASYVMRGMRLSMRESEDNPTKRIKKSTTLIKGAKVRQ